jgi:hypothetical protein
MPKGMSYKLVEPPQVEWCGNRPFAHARMSDEHAMVLEDLALKKEAEIRALPVTTGWEKAAESNPTTARFSRYSVFHLSPETLPLYFAIHETYRYLLEAMGQPPVPRFIQCWYNIHRAGQHLGRHAHTFPFIGVFSAHAVGSLTRYGETPKDSDEDVFVEHAPGQVFITTGLGHYHTTSVWQDENRARITYAFDIIDADQWNPRQVFLPFDT